MPAAVVTDRAAYVFRNAADEEPAFSSPWEGYTNYKGILLSGGRGGREISDIQVYETVPDVAFLSFEPVDYQVLQ